MVTPVDETDLSFQYYEGSNITANWSSTAGTLYGGYVDLVTGELVKTHEYVHLVGTEDWLI